jgi:hypothetical protein
MLTIPVGDAKAIPVVDKGRIHGDQAREKLANEIKVTTKTL